MLTDSLPVITFKPAAGDTVVLDLSQNSVWIIQMPAGNITIGNPVNAQPGEALYLIIIQNGIGLRTITWASAFKKSVTLSVAAGARDTIAFFYDGTYWNQFGSTLAIA
jgi:hypothetical protein